MNSEHLKQVAGTLDPASYPKLHKKIKYTVKVHLPNLAIIKEITSHCLLNIHGHDLWRCLCKGDVQKYK